VRSAHAETFNHDEDAAGYDADVVDETNPIRAGYQATLEWVVAHAIIAPDDVVVDLGVGTGNLARRLPPCARLIGVDVSGQMLELAGAKLGPEVELVQSDLLELFEGPGSGAQPLDGVGFDAVVSTYAIHHLTAAEKESLIGAVAARLRPGGRFVIGDLMAAGRVSIPGIKARIPHPDVHDLFAEEFPWFVDETLTALAAADFTRLAAEQLSDLSWGLAAHRP
jgi:tRNA (cmo5U34)-methyltransferase